MCDLWGSRRVAFLDFESLGFSFEVMEGERDVRFRFELGRGQYATNVMREFMKNGGEAGEGGGTKRKRAQEDEREEKQPEQKK